MADRIDIDRKGEPDDVVIEGVDMFRLERMGAGRFWLACYRAGKPDVSFWLYSTHNIKCTYEVRPDGSEDRDD